MYTAKYLADLNARLEKARLEIYEIGREIDKVVHFLEIKEKEPITLSKDDKEEIVAEMIKSMTYDPAEIK